MGAIDSAYALKIVGDSMAPIYRDGSVIVVSPVVLVDGGGRRDHNDAPIAIDGRHRIADYLECIGAVVGNGGKGQLIPSLAGRMAGIVKMAVRGGLSEVDHRHAVRA